MSSDSQEIYKSQVKESKVSTESLHKHDLNTILSFFHPSDEEYGEQSVSVMLDGEESEIMFLDHPADEMTVSAGKGREGRAGKGEEKGREGVKGREGEEGESWEEGKETNRGKGGSERGWEKGGGKGMGGKEELGRG